MVFQVRRGFILIIAILAWACEQDPLPEPERAMPKSIRPHVERFLREAEKRGLSPDISKLSIEFDTDIDISTGDNQQTVVGSCSRSTNLHLVRIDTLNSLWLLSGYLGREEIIFHELGHCLLERQHRDDKLLSGDYASILRTVGLLQYGDLSQYTSLILNQAGLKAHRRDYYLDELFDQTTPVPCWSDSKIDSPYEVRSFDDAFIKEWNYWNMWIGPKDELWLYTGNSCHIFSGGTFKSVFPGTTITDLQNDNMGNLWVAGIKEGVSFINTYKKGELGENPGSVSLPAGLSRIGKIFIDDLNRLWITGDEGDVYIRNANLDFEMIEVIPDRRVTKILQGPDKKVYMLKGQMFLIFDADLNPFIMNDENSDLPTDLFGDMAVDDQGVAWLRYNRPAPKLIRLMPDGQVELFDFYDINLAEIRVNSLAIDRMNNLWIATSKGIRRWEGNTFSGYCSYNTGLDILDFNSIVAGDGIIWSMGKDTLNQELKLLRTRIEL